MPDNESYPVESIQNKRALEALLNFVDHVNKIDSIEEAIWHVAQHTIKSLGFEDCVVYLLDDDQLHLSQVAAYGPKNPKKRQITNAIKLKLGQGIVGKAAAESRSIMVADTRLEADYVVDDQSRLSELAVPIRFHSKVLGVIDSEHQNSHFYTELHRSYLEILAGILASKITFNSNIYELEDSYRSLEKAKMLSDTFLLISELTYHSTTIEDFYLGLHKIIAQQVDTHSFFVVLLDTDENRYSCPYLHDEQKGGEFDSSIDHQKMSETLIAEVIAAQQPRLAHFDELEKRIKDGRMINRGPHVYSWLAVPFQITPSLQGAIALQSYDQQKSFKDNDKEFLTFLGQHISTAIDQKLKDQKLQYQALHDSVTGLTSRSLFLDRLEHAFIRASRSQTPEIAVLFIDFDDFKLINDNFGHQAGDEILKEAAQRMQSQLRSSDTIARIGGDEFAILLEDLDNETMTMAISQRILDVIKKPIQTAKKSIVASISIGIGLKDETVNRFEDLLKNADHAMYHAKSKGKNTIQVYEASLHKSVLSARRILDELKIAIKERQLFFYYQPIVDLKTRRIVGFEALMRWQHPKRGLITPEEFIHIAEQNDLIREIDSQLFDSVAQQLVHWKTLTPEHFYISINISSQRFVDSRLINEIKTILHQYQLPKNSIVVELTEHILMKNIAKARNLFYQLKRLGIKISLDDFGTGYSSLSYINQLPFDVIKIDHSFVSHINKLKPDHPIISIIVSLAKTLNIEIVAEGIETMHQFEVLKSLDCDFGQGFILAKPMPAIATNALVVDPLFDPGKPKP